MDGTSSSSPSSSRVILTETNEVIENLRKNLERNYPSLSFNDETTSNCKGNGNQTNAPIHRLFVDELDWLRCKDDCANANIEAHSVDCIVGTDVVFSTRFVLPMLETMRFLSHPKTVIYLCLQERCKDSHQLLLKEAIRYGFRVEDISETVYDDKDLARSCGFGRALECKLLKLTVVVGTNLKEKLKKETKNKRKEQR